MILKVWYNVRPPSCVCWFISPSNYSYKYHKPQLLELCSPTETLYMTPNYKPRLFQEHAGVLLAASRCITSWRHPSDVSSQDSIPRLVVIRSGLINICGDMYVCMYIYKYQIDRKVPKIAWQWKRQGVGGSVGWGVGFFSE